MKKFKKILSVALTVLLVTACFSITVFADDIAHGVLRNGVEWTVTEDNVLTFSGEGEIPAYEYGTTPWAKYINDIGSVKIEEGITYIGKNALSDLYEDMGDLILPDSLTGVDEGFIYNSTFSGTLYIGKNYQNCSALQFISGSVLASSFDTITVSEENEELVQVGNNVLTADGKTLVFLMENNDGKLVIPDGIENIGAGCAFFSDANGELLIPESVKNIGEKAFYGCGHLEGTLIIPETVENVGACAFEGCFGFTGIEYSSETEFSNDMPFAGCTNVASVKIDDVAMTKADLENISCSRFHGIGMTLENEKRTYGFTSIGHQMGEVSATCKNCSEKFVYQTGTDVRRHQFTYSGTNAPTCTEYGRDNYYCSCCYGFKAVNIPPTGHTPDEAVEEITCYPTCVYMGTGNLVVRCKVCREVLSSEPITIETTEHNWSEWSRSKDNKSESRYCYSCSKEETRKVSRTFCEIIRDFFNKIIEFFKNIF